MVGPLVAVAAESCVSGGVLSLWVLPWEVA